MPARWHLHAPTPYAMPAQPVLPNLCVFGNHVPENGEDTNTVMLEVAVM